MKKQKKVQPLKKSKIKRGDTVEVISGEDKGARGEVLSVDLTNARVTVKGVNMIKKTMQKTQENQRGGINEQEGSINLSNVMYVSKEDDKPTRIGIKEVDGERKRYEKRSGVVIEK